MATSYTDRVPGWYWVVAGLALLWELMGCYSYIAQVSMTADEFARMPEAERALMAGAPVWTTAAFGVATWGGLAGAVGLLLRRRWARPLLILSLAAIVVQFTWWLLIARAGDVIGSSVYTMPAAIFIVGALLVWFSNMAAKRGWLR